MRLAKRCILGYVVFVIVLNVFCDPLEQVVYVVAEWCEEKGWL